MEMQNHSDEQTCATGSWFRRHRFISYGALAVLAYYLLTEHLEHVWALLPFLLLAACPLMHIFMHHGHHGHHHSNHEENHHES